MDDLAAANNNDSFKRKDCPADLNLTVGQPVVNSTTIEPNIKRLKKETEGKNLESNNMIASNNSSGTHIHNHGHANTVANSDEPTSVIRVIIENMLYPVTLEALHEVFLKAGKVEKIVTFNKNGKFQSLVQFNSPRAAQIAKSTLDNQNIYPNACFMRIDYSILTTLNVKFNNDKSRDFTNPNLPQGSSGPPAPTSMGHNSAGPQANMPKDNSNAIIKNKNHNDPTSGIVLGANQNPVANGQTNASSSHNLAQQLEPLLVNPVDSASLAPMLKLASTNSSFNALAAAILASLQRSNNNPSSEPNSTNFAALANGHGLSQAHNQFAMAYNNYQQQTIQQQQQRMIHCGPVLLASNLDEQLATPEALFKLFGVFGDVMRVKILFNKKDNALIQMAEANQAQVAQSYLDRQKIYGKMIRVTRSKHQVVQMPKDGNQSDAGLTKDFSNSPLHRFKVPGSRNYLNIYPPSSTLHVSNIPASVSEVDINNAFKKECGFEFATLKFFPKDRKMALIRLNSVEQAIIALICMHNYQISDDNHLRVSFSKSPIHE